MAVIAVSECGGERVCESSVCICAVSVLECERASE